MSKKEEKKAAVPPVPPEPGDPGHVDIGNPSPGAAVNQAEWTYDKDLGWIPIKKYFEVKNE